MRLASCLAIALVGAGAADGAAVMSPEDAAFLQREAGALVASARVGPGGHAGGQVNATPYPMLLPDGRQAYHAFWVRDASMALQCGVVPDDDVRGWIRLIAATVSPRDWQVRPGVRVPAFSVPDHINFDGRPTYFPGGYETGDRQGGGVYGTLPPLDDAYFFLFAVAGEAAFSGNLAFFRSPVRLKDGPDVPVAKLCRQIYDATPVDRTTGMVLTGEPDAPGGHAKDFGFCDRVVKSGQLLFPSVLRYDAATRLAALYRQAGDKAAAARFEQDAQRIRSHLAAVFFHPSQRPNEGWLHSATGQGNQPDVWGSAYAVAIGAVDAATSPQIARALLRGFREQATVVTGCVDEIVPNDPAHPHGWTNTPQPYLTYQNGGYWPTASGWYIAALATIDGGAAQAMTRDYLAFLRTQRSDTGTAQAWEWFSPELRRSVHPQYVASVALPYGVLRRAGLLPGPAKPATPDRSRSGT